MLSISHHRGGAAVAAVLVLVTLASPAAHAVALPAPVFHAPVADEAIVGSWDGALSGPEFELRVVFHIAAADDGALTATLDSPDQGATGIPVDEVTFEDGRLRMRIAAIAGGYDGALLEDGEHLEGTWTQGGQSLPLNLARRADG